MPGPAENLYPSMVEEDNPSAYEPKDDEMKLIRKGWTMYPAEVEKMITTAMFDEYIGKDIEVNGKTVKATKEITRRAVSELRALVGDLSLSRDEFEDLMETVRSVKPQAEFDEKAVIPMREATVEALNREHNDKAFKAFKAARAYVAKNPILGDILDKSGLGDQPKVVAVIARKALALHESGKLSIK